MQPHPGTNQWQPPYQPQPQWSAAPAEPEGSAGQTGLLWAILVLLVVNLGFTLYLFGVVHHVVSSVQSAFG
jgi:uncharacterized protein HemX